MSFLSSCFVFLCLLASCLALHPNTELDYYRRQPSFPAREHLIQFAPPSYRSRSRRITAPHGYGNGRRFAEEDNSESRDYDDSYLDAISRRQPSRFAFGDNWRFRM